MKKICVVLLCAILCFSFLGLATGCDDKEEETPPVDGEYQNISIDLEKMKVGDAVPVYPTVEFDYIVVPWSNDNPDNTKEYTFHIASCSAELISKNSVHRGETLTEAFYPYEVELRISGSTSAELAGYTFSADFCCKTSFYDIIFLDFVISPSGEFTGSKVVGIGDVDPAPICFNYISNHCW